MTYESGSVEWVEAMGGGDEADEGGLGSSGGCTCTYDGVFETGRG